jgi:hypothetical protein
VNSTFAPPPGTTPVPGTVAVPTPVPTPPAPAPQTPAPQAPPPGDAAANQAPVTSAGLGLAQVILTPPGTAFRVGGGPYTVPISITNAARLSTVTLTLTYDPQLLRARAVNEGSFMRSGGANATFTQQANNGRIDITIIRSADAVCATGTGLLGAVLFDAVAPGTVAFGLSGSGTGPGGTPMGLQFVPASVTIQP